MNFLPNLQSICHSEITWMWVSINFFHSRILSQNLMNISLFVCLFVVYFVVDFISFHSLSIIRTNHKKWDVFVCLFVNVRSVVWVEWGHWLRRLVGSPKVAYQRVGGRRQQGDEGEEATRARRRRGRGGEEGEETRRARRRGGRGDEEGEETRRARRRRRWRGDEGE
jgi:hypothetical protein